MALVKKFDVEELCKAAETGDLKNVEVCLQNGVDVNGTSGPNEMTPLHKAAGNGHFQIVKLLLCEGADLNSRDKDKMTPLHKAAGNGHLEIVKFLFSGGAVLDSRDKYGGTPLYNASVGDHVEVVDYLLSQGAEVDIITNHDIDGLIDAADSGQLEDIKEYPQKALKVNQRNKYNFRGLCNAAHDGRLEDVKEHVQNGIHVNGKDGLHTPLDLAHDHDHSQVVEYLLSKGAKVNNCRKYNVRGLCNAAGAGRLEDVKEHLQNGVDVNESDLHNTTPLDRAFDHGHCQVIEYLLSCGAKVKQHNQYNIEGLCNAAGEGRLEDVKGHLQNGVDINERDQVGQTALHKATSHNQLEIVEFLIIKGAKLDIKDDYNQKAADVKGSTGLRSTIAVWKQTKKNTISALQKCINKAKNSKGKVKIRFIKILFTGSPASGKTSFSNLLMKNKFVDFHHSTNIVQAKHAVSVNQAVVVGLNQRDDHNVVWLEMDDDSQMSHLTQILLSLDVSSLQKTQIVKEQKKTSGSLSPLSQPKTTTSTSTSAISDNKAQKSSMKKQYVTHQRTSITQRVTGLVQGSVKSEKMASFDCLVQNSIESNSGIKHDFTYNRDVLNIITILDTGGQPEYMHILPTIRIHPMVTFVVHDLSKSLEDQVLVEFSEHGKLVFEPYHLEYSNLDMIKFLMSSVNDSLERLSQLPQLVTIPGKNNNAYVCCVGTHTDKVGLDIIRHIDDRLTAVVEKLDCKAAVWENTEGGVVFPVDNTTAGDDTKEDPLANFIRNKIDILAANNDIYEIPMTWMLFEMELRQVCSNNGKAYISFKECCTIAQQINLISSIEEIKSALMYHHLLGALLYYPDLPGLCDYIIVDHQWLFDRISSIVCFIFKHSSNIHAKHNFKYNGILTKALIQELYWQEELKEEYFIALLVEMKIIAPIKREEGTECDYFIPYILPTYTIQSQFDELLSKHGCLQGEPLLIQFISNLLPRGFFCCLVVQLLQQLTDSWGQLFTQKDTRHTYSNLITFRLQSTYSLSLLDKLSYLEVQIRHQESDYYHQFPIHSKVQEFLAGALEVVCENLTFHSGRLIYGFHCKCGEYDNEHIAVPTRATPPFDYASCRCGSIISTKLNKGHTIWLGDESSHHVHHNLSGKWHPEATMKVYKDFRVKLIKSLPMNDSLFLEKLKNQSLLPDDLNEEIQAKNTTAKKSVCFLDNVIDHSLSINNYEFLHKLLFVMSDEKDIKNDLLKQLSAEIQEELHKETSFITREGTVSTETISAVQEDRVMLPSTRNENEVIKRKPEMFYLTKIVIPKIMNEWEYVAEAFLYDLATIEAIKERGGGDPKQCCREFFKDWLRTDHGHRVGPKVWSTLLDILNEVDEISAEITENIATNVKQLQYH